MKEIKQASCKILLQFSNFHLGSYTHMSLFNLIQSYKLKRVSHTSQYVFIIFQIHILIVMSSSHMPSSNTKKILIFVKERSHTFLLLKR